MTSKARAGWIIGGTAMIFGITSLACWLLWEPYYSDPGLSRLPALAGSDLVYQVSHSPLTKSAVHPGIGMPFAAVERTSSGNLVHLTFDKRRFVKRGDRNLMYQTLEADPKTNLIEIPEGGTIELTAIAHVFDPLKGTPAKRARDDRDGIAAMYVHPKSLNPIDPADMEAAGIPENDLTFPDFQYQENQSLVRAVLKPQETPEIRYKRVAVFDARTDWKVNGGGGGGGEVGRPVVTTGLKLWHDTPILLTYNIASGPVVETDIPTDQIGWQTIVNNEFRVQFLTHEPSWTSTVNWEKKGLAEITIKDTKHLSKAYFLVDDPRFSEACIIRAIGHNGRIENHSLTSCSPQMYSASLRLPKEDIAKLQIRYFPNHYRLQYRIEKLPDFPDDNQGVTNLFLARIPHVMVKSETGLCSFVSSATHNTFTDPYRQDVERRFPANYFPKEFTDVTAKELLEEYERHTIGPQALSVAHGEYTISRRKPPTFGESVKALFPRWF